MYTRIMAAIDDSFATGDVLETAITLAQRFGAKLAICHALDERILSRHEPDVMLPSSFGQVQVNLRTGAREFLEKAAEVARKAGVDVEIRLVESEESQVAEMLAGDASEWQADLLVVGSHGRRGVERFFVGSVAERLVNKASTSLLLVRSQ
jgi:nucleotide-binding universal stress UspA family protein